MSEANNKAVIRRFFEDLWNNRNLTAADELFDPECISHQLRSKTKPGGVSRTSESFKQEIGRWLVGFPDLNFRIEQMISEDDRVVTHCTVTGTRKGQLTGIEPSGNQVDFPMIVIHRLRNGRIVEDWVLVGALILFQQLGIIQPTEELLAAASDQVS